MYKKGINPKNIKLINEFIKNYKFEEDIYHETLTRVLSINKDVAIEVLQGLCQIYGPIHIETFVNVLCFKKSDTTYND